MSFRIKILLPFLILFLLVGGYIKLFWLPNLVQHEVQKMSVQEQSFLEVLGTAMTPALLKGDLAEIHGTLDRAKELHPEWVFITFKDSAGRRLYPIELKEHMDHSDHIVFTNKIYFGSQYLGEMHVELDTGQIAKSVEEPVTHLEIIIHVVLLMMSVLCVLFLEIWLLKPLRKLKSGTVSLAEGDFEVALPDAKSRDEIGRLIHSFSAMRDDLRHRELELLSERNFSKAIIDSAGSIIVVLDRHGKIVLLNKAGQLLTEYQSSEVEGKFIFDIFILPDEREQVLSVFLDLKSGNFPSEYENFWRTKSGNKIMISWANACTTDEKGGVEYVVGIGIDITERHRLQMQIASVMKNLEKANAKLHKYVEVIDHSVLTSSTDLDGTIISVSEAFCKISGYRSDELIGQSHNIVRHPETPSEVYKKLWQTISSGKEWHGELKNLCKDGTDFSVEIIITPNLDDNGVIESYTAIREDITYRKQVEKMAITDALTNLYNRRHFEIVFDQELRRAQRDHRKLVFIMFDVDHFKQYNDTYGHQEGDQVLQAIGKTLNDFLHRPSDFGFRLGGEEFGILIQGETEDEAFAFADRYRKVIEDLAIKHEFNSASPVLTISLGVALISPNSMSDKRYIFKVVDDALYLAKESGRNQVQIAKLQDTKKDDKL